MHTERSDERAAIAASHEADANPPARLPRGTAPPYRDPVLTRDEQRLTNLRTTLGFLQLPPTEPEVVALHQCFDSWSGLGMIAVGISRQGWDLQLGQHSNVGGTLKG